MNLKLLGIIVLYAAVTAIAVVVIFKIFGWENPGPVAAAVAAAVSVVVVSSKKKKAEK